MINKKAQVGLGNLQNIVWLLVVIGIMLAIGLVVLAELADNDSMRTYSDTVNYTTNEAGVAVNETINAIAEVPGWLSIIVIVVIAAIILGLVQFFKGRNQ